MRQVADVAPRVGKCTPSAQGPPLFTDAPQAATVAHGLNHPKIN
jgi:hypothetical protein